MQVLPLTPDRWSSFEELFGPRGACEGCWCMYWRRPASEYRAGRGNENRMLMHELVRLGRVPGLIGFEGDRPAGWVSVGPRSSYPRFASSRLLKPVDDLPVWSIVCIFVAAPLRGRGLSRHLIEAACDYAFGHGAPAVEAYPHDLGERREPAPFVFTGLASAFLREGFEVVARPSPRRPVVRRYR